MSKLHMRFGRVPRYDGRGESHSLMMTKEGTFTIIPHVVVVRHLGGLLCVVGPVEWGPLP